MSLPPSASPPHCPARLDGDPATFLFTDVEGSTRLWETQPQEMQRELAHHDTILRDAVDRAGGKVFKTVGDAFCAWFPSTQSALRAALDAQTRLRSEAPRLRVRMAVHSGAAERRDADYFGPALNRVARLLGATHGGQVLTTRACRDELDHAQLKDVRFRLLGRHKLRDILEWEELYQVEAAGRPEFFPAPLTEDVIYRRAVARTAGIAGLILAVVGVLAGVAWSQKQLAQRRATSETRQRRITNQLLYAADMSRGIAGVRNGDQELVRRVLEAQTPRAGEPDLRGWEWRLLRHRAQVGDSLETHRLPGPAGGLAFSALRQLVAVPMADGSIYLRNLSNGRERTLPGHRGGAVCAAFSADGNALATGGQDGTLRIWDLRSGRPMGPPRKHRFPVVCVAFQPDGRAVAAGADFNHSRDRMTTAEESQELSRLRIWPLDYTQPARTVIVPGSMGIVALAYSPDGDELAVGCFDPSVRLVNARSGAVRRVLAGHSGSVYSVAYGAGGQLLATGSFDSTARIWALGHPDAPPTVLRGYSGIRSVAFGARPGVLATSGVDGVVRLWGFSSAEGVARETGSLSGHRGTVLGLASVGGTGFVTAGDDATLRVWPTAAQDGARVVARLGGPSTLAVSPVGGMIAAATGPSVSLWNPTAARPLRRWKVREAVTTLAFSPDGALLAAGTGGWNQLPGTPNELCIFEAPSGKLIARLLAAGPSNVGIGFSPDGRLFIAGDQTGRFRIWETRSWTVRSTGQGDPSAPIAFLFEPNGAGFYLAQWSGKITHWDTSARQLDRGMQGDPQLTHAALSRDGRLLVAGSLSSPVRIWSPTVGGQGATLPGSGPAVGCSFAPDGRTVAVAEPGGRIRLWTTSTTPPEQVGDLDAGSSLMIAVPTFSADGRFLAIAPADGDVKLWEASR